MTVVSIISMTYAITLASSTPSELMHRSQNADHANEQIDDVPAMYVGPTRQFGENRPRDVSRSRKKDAAHSLLGRVRYHSNRLLEPTN